MSEPAWMTALRHARIARAQTIRGIHAEIAIDFPGEEAIAMTACVLDTNAEEVAAALRGNADDAQ